MNSYSKTSATSSHFSNISQQSRQGKSAVRLSQKEAALPAKGSNSSTAAKNKNLMKCQECNRQCKQADQAKPPRKPPPEWANISDFAREPAAREQPKADRE
jgi:predicted metal-binding protein